MFNVVDGLDDHREKRNFIEVGDWAQMIDLPHSRFSPLPHCRSSDPLKGGIHCGNFGAPQSAALCRSPLPHSHNCGNAVREWEIRLRGIRHKLSARRAHLNGASLSKYLVVEAANRSN